MLVMDSGTPSGHLDLMLVGHNATNLHDSTTENSAETFSQAGKTYTKQDLDSGRSLSSFFRQNSRPSQQQQQKSSVTKKKQHAQSYVDDTNTLFANSKLANPDWPAPWEDSVKSKTLAFHEEGASSYRPEKYTTSPQSRPQSRCTTASKRGSQTERQTKASGKMQVIGCPASARSVPQRGGYGTTKPSLKRPPMLLKHTQSYCDDMLFGPKLAEPEFRAPWEKSIGRPQPKAFNFDYTNYKSKVIAGQQSRPQSSQKIRHSQSYVDESLFGPKLAEPGWRAPWDDGKDAAHKINIYDAYNHKVTIQHDDVDVVKPKGIVAMQRQKAPSTAKPAWR